MDTLKKIFPQAFKATNVNALIISLIIYLVIGIVGGAAIGLLAGIPLIGLIFQVLGAIVSLFSLLGIILSILVFLKVVQ